MKKTLILISIVALISLLSVFIFLSMNKGSINQNHFSYGNHGSIIISSLNVKENESPVEIVFMKKANGLFQPQRTLTMRVGNGSVYNRKNFNELFKGIDAGQEFYISLQRNGVEFEKSSIQMY